MSDRVPRDSVVYELQVKELAMVSEQLSEEQSSNRDPRRATLEYGRTVVGQNAGFLLAFEQLSRRVVEFAYFAGDRNEHFAMFACTNDALKLIGEFGLLSVSEYRVLVGMLDLLAALTLGHETEDDESVILRRASDIEYQLVYAIEKAWRMR